jgi:hypothetical protein
MSDTATLGGVLALDGPAAEKLVDASGLREKLGEVPARLVTPLLGKLWPLVAARVNSVLDVPIPRLLASGWSRYTELWKYSDPDAYPPGKVTVLNLAPHTLRSVHRPHVQVEIAGAVPIKLRLDFEVDLTAEVKDAALTIEGGRVREILGGEASYRVTLGCRGQRIRAVEESFTIPTLAFPEGIAIVPVARPASSPAPVDEETVEEETEAELEPEEVPEPAAG